MVHYILVCFKVFGSHVVLQPPFGSVLLSTIWYSALMGLYFIATQLFMFNLFVLLGKQKITSSISQFGVPFIVFCYQMLKNSILLIMPKWAQHALVTVNVAVLLPQMRPHFFFFIVQFLTGWFFIAWPFPIWQTFFRLLITF